MGYWHRDEGTSTDTVTSGRWRRSQYEWRLSGSIRHVLRQEISYEQVKQDLTEFTAPFISRLSRKQGKRTV